MSMDDIDDADIARRVARYARAEVTQEVARAKDLRDWRIAQLATVLLVEFRVWFDGGEWVAAVGPEDDEEVGHGSTPVSAMIDAEIHLRRGGYDTPKPEVTT